MKKIVVLGSMNMDLTILADPFPGKGETVTGSGYAQVPGGKGANQAVAAGRLGADITFIGSCGNDSFGNTLIDEMSKSNVNTENIMRADTHTGIALIVREADGDNRIILAAGANIQLIPSSLAKIKNKITDADILLLQLEIPLKSVEYAAKLAKKSGMTVILDPAPAFKLPHKLLSNIDYLLPNEHELDLVLGNPSGSFKEKAALLIRMGVGNVILTEGEKGVIISSGSGETRIKAPVMEAVDTTAAGDTFAGAFAYGLASGWDAVKAAGFAVRAASLSVTKVGAQSSIPWLEEVQGMEN